VFWCWIVSKKHTSNMKGEVVKYRVCRCKS
jgi:hypothetical protein